jgi:hypothetical protein
MSAVPPCEPFCGPIPPGGIAPPFLSIAGEISFGFVLDRFATDPAQAVDFTTIFSFLQPAAALVGAPLKFPGIVLNPVSNLFDMPEPGVLRYIGDAPARFAIHGQSGFLWFQSTEIPIRDVIFLMSIAVNDDIGNGHSGWASPRIRLVGTPDSPGVSAVLAAGSLHAQGLYELQPGDELTLGLAAVSVNPADLPAGTNIEMIMAEYSLMAYKI